MAHLKKKVEVEGNMIFWQEDIWNHCLVCQNLIGTFRLVERSKSEPRRVFSPLHFFSMVASDLWEEKS